MKTTFRRFSIFNLFASIFILLSTGCSNSDDYEIFAAIHGCVTDYTTGSPLDNATVTLSPSGMTKLTDAFGHYEFSNLEASQYTITVQREGYQPNRKQLNTFSGENFQVDIQLKPIPEN